MDVPKAKPAVIVGYIVLVPIVRKSFFPVRADEK